jgi:hypothetical protein
MPQNRCSEQRSRCCCVASGCHTDNPGLFEDSGFWQNPGLFEDPGFRQNLFAQALVVVMMCVCGVVTLSCILLRNLRHNTTFTLRFGGKL